MTRQIAALAVVIVLGTVITGCGDSPRRERRTVSPALAEAVRFETPPPTPIRLQNRFARGLPTGRRPAIQAPPAPGTLPALAASSIDTVVQLHDIVAAAARSLSLPRGALSGEATDLVGRFSQMHAALGSSLTGPRAGLGAALDGYRVIARALVGGSGTATPAVVGQLLRLDGKWREALRGIGGHRLLATVPRLLAPPPPTDALRTEPGGLKCPTHASPAHPSAPCARGK